MLGNGRKTCSVEAFMVIYCEQMEEVRAKYNLDRSILNFEGNL